jgi:hypothetical protein
VCCTFSRGDAREKLTGFEGIVSCFHFEVFEFEGLDTRVRDGQGAIFWEYLVSVTISIVLGFDGQ